MEHNLSNSQAEKQLVRVSKFLSLILRHKPETIGLTLDKYGWANVNILVERAGKNGTIIDRLTIERVVTENHKKRFAFNSDRSKIRACQRHSIAVDLSLIPQQPSEYLYHGTATRFLNSILSQGILKQNRQQVHLSAERSTAIQVGQRHGKPIVLKVESGKCAIAELNFFLSENKVWLTDNVPPKYITVD